MNRYRRQKPRRGRAPVLIVSFLLIVIIALFSIWKSAGNFQYSILENVENRSLHDLWSHAEYIEVLRITEEQLEDSPLNPSLLMLNGFSHFYLAVSQVSYEEMIPFLDACIFNLRKSLIAEDFTATEMVYYVLGKAYFYKGPYYSDLSVKYLFKSIDNGYINDDSYEFLAQAYSRLGDFDNSLKYYYLAAENYPTDLIYIKIAEDSFTYGQYNQSEKYYLLAIEQTSDQSLKKKGLFQLGKLYYDMKNYVKSRDVFENLVELGVETDEVHFFLGEIYHALNDEPRARLEWKRATWINPDHKASLHRLYD